MAFILECTVVSPAMGHARSLSFSLTRRNTSLLVRLTAIGDQVGAKRDKHGVRILRRTPLAAPAGVTDYGIGRALQCPIASASPMREIVPAW